MNLKSTKVKVSGSKGEALKRKLIHVPNAAIRVMANSVMCAKCRK